MYTKKKNADGSTTYSLTRTGENVGLIAGGTLIGFSLGYLVKALVGGGK